MVGRRMHGLYLTQKHALEWEENPHAVTHLSAQIWNVYLDNITLNQTSFTLLNQTILVMFTPFRGNLPLAQARKYGN